ncbi:methyltransferase [Colwellia sp. 1_MG-2023]|jgi:16S rRNA (guanine1207-N2)-methyltransferase|uniref:methyltransferase n=1 Tax=unclassified Colwellia TaxID=196834 RepID=UPI001C0A0100|nr:MULTISPECIES: methyltransferase [unclassified Colwellia]MBU2924085.1 methyltransferase [Colwellia sp. C2M11]MDO6651976.1 methyltransferase [Colwellia sp. 3_MG-2023]MDO6664752.1 methyltransferase [Colwellia sp. 2_MG-2023]MDO6689206.1 methyltransferase [Colwellia sp. 1_MG-2023]
MSTSNISQILVRNSALLSAKTPLFINLMADGFIESYLLDNPEAQLSCHNTNFVDYLAIKNKFDKQVETSFASEYKTERQHDLVVINFPKSKDELAFTFAVIAPYLSNDAKVILVGEKKGGIQSSPKLTGEFLQNCQKIDAARHCLLFAGIVNPENLNKPFNIEDWFKQYQININNISLTIASLPGVFSQKKLDIGTALLLDNLPQFMQGKVLDFGCGAGVISCFIGKKFESTQLDLLDVSALAITSAQKTLALNNLSGTVFASNSLSNVAGKYQHIVSNPPFHQGTKTSYQASEDFLRGIKPHIEPRGDITIVANSFLQYLPIMQEYIGTTKRLINKQGFNIYHCRAN